MKFNDFDLSDALKSGLKDVNFIEPTPIQEKSIPAVLEGKDLIGTAQTGTGKTGAFVIPILERIERSKTKGTQAVIITPTRELAQQIDQEIFAIGYHTGVTSATVIGGSDFSVQAKALNAGVDVIVATPGRLIDQNKIVNIDFSNVECLVLDEADRMLDMGFLPDMKKIISWMPERRQTLLFSATMPKEIKQLAGSIMNNPVTVEIERSKPSQSVQQRAYLLKSDQKVALVKQIFDTIDWESCIIFTSTKKGTDELQRLLKKEGIKAASIHGDRSQDERNKALSAFKNRQIPVIVATNVLARGIDIKDVSMIVNYDVPRSSDDYIHRIGRTGRYDKSGIAVTFVTRRDNRAFRDIDQIKGNQIKKIKLPDSFDESTHFYWEKDDKEEADSREKQNKNQPQNRKQKQQAKGDSPSGTDDPSDKSRVSKTQPEKIDQGSGKKSASGKISDKKGSSPKNKKSSRGKQGKPESHETGKSSKPGSSRGKSNRTNGSKKSSDNHRPDKGNHTTSITHRRDAKDNPEDNRKEEVEESVIIPSRVDKATERKQYTRGPAKGIWGIIKSIIPKIKRN